MEMSGKPWPSGRLEPAAKYDVARYVKDFETEKVAEADRRKTARILIASGGPDRALGVRLKGCNPISPCGSGICAACLRRSRRQVGGAIMKLLDEVGKPAKWVTLIDKRKRMNLGKLRTLDLYAEGRSLSRKISRSVIREAVVVAGYDFSVEYDERKSCDVWQMHVHGLVIGAEDAEIHSALDGYVPRDESDKGFKPIVVKTVGPTLTDRANVATYVLKARIERRPFFLADDEKIGFYKAIRLRRKLEEKELLELARYLGHRDIGARLILRGVRGHGCTLAPIKPPTRSITDNDDSFA